MTSSNFLDSASPFNIGGMIGASMRALAMDSALFDETLRTHVRAALKTAEKSADVKELEPRLVDIVRFVSSNPTRLHAADRLLAGLVPLLCETPPPYGLAELLGYCVHTLDLPEVVASARERRLQALDELSCGESRRPWEHARRCEQVIEAAGPEWEDREMFASLSS